MAKLPKTQIELEWQMRIEGQEKFIKTLNKARGRGDIATTSPGKKVIDVMMAAHVKMIEAWMAKSLKGGAGNRASLAKLVKDIEPEVLSYFTARYVLNGIALNQALVTTQLELGTAISDEMRLRTFYKLNRGAFKWVERQLQERGVTQRHYKLAFYNRVAKLKGIELPTLPKAQRVQIGLALIELMTRATPAFVSYSIYKVRMGKYYKTKKDLVLSPAAAYTMINNKNAILRGAVIYQPMIEAPIPRTGYMGGGYHDAEIGKPLVIHEPGSMAEKKHRKLIEAQDPLEVYRAINHLSETRFKINKPVLEMVQWAFEKNLPVGKLPPKEDFPLPEKPHDIATNEAARRDYRKQARAVYEKNAELQSGRFAAIHTMDTAEKFAEAEAIYFPKQLDFRGRVYDIPIIFNTQSADYARALVCFADGKPIEDDVAMGWLMIHGANCFGYDKVTLEERIKWVEDHLQEIRESVYDARKNKFWIEADKPFSFLAWAYDFIGVLDHGADSYIRVAMDGSCNGLQHLSAMLRDPVGAKAVNLAANTKPADVYQQVADVVLTKLAKFKGQEKHWADILKPMVDRKLTKRSVMVMPYGGTFHSTLKYVEEGLDAKLKGDNPFGDDKGKAILLLSRCVYDATREVIQGGQIAMKWLQEVATVAAKYNVHLHWKLPHGFVAMQEYRQYKKREVVVRLDGHKVNKLRTNLYEPLNKIDVRRSANSISPNFVHSLDACALMMTVNKCWELGVKSFHMVHDDYGTYAADTQVMWECLREAFVELYRDRDVLGDFRAEVLRQLPPEAHKEVPQVPKAGTFNIEEVLASDFFFA